MARRASTTATAEPTPEDHVRRYLQYLTDPESLRDEAAIRKALDDVAQATDPIAKVRALTALERAEAVDGDVFRDAFMAHVAGWVESTGVTASALASFGVPEEDLVEAKLLDPQPTRRRPKAPVVKGRAPRLDPSEVAAKMKKGTEYRLTDIARLVDREPATTRNYVNRLLEAGVVEDLGADPNHEGKGKAPHVYRLA